VLPDAADLLALLRGGWTWKQLRAQFGVCRNTLKNRLADSGLGFFDTSARCGGDSASLTLAALVVESRVEPGDQSLRSARLD
jgi:hypothetical protein